MKKWLGLFCGVLAMPAVAGVEMDLTTSNAGGAVTEQMKIYAEGGNIRIDDADDSPEDNVSMIFLGDRFIVLNHAEQNYVVVDEAMMAAVGAQINNVMAQMEQQMANLPPEQQAMMQQMMESQFGDMMNPPEPPPPPDVQAMGTGDWQGDSCDLYGVYESGVKVSEVCTAPLADVNGADDVILAFENMANFMRDMAEAFPGPMSEGMMDNPMDIITELDGFPVVTREYAGELMESETLLESVSEGDLDPALFAPPAGYTEVDPLNQ